MNKFSVTGTGVSWSIIAASLLVGFFTRFINIVHVTVFWPIDQVRDALVVIAMRKGIFPILGPTTNVDFGIPHYHLPPLYYYLLFPADVFGFNPIYQILPNAIFSFLSIPLMIFSLYHFLGENVLKPRRLFFAASGGLWWSLILSDITHANKEYNPSPIPFFLLLFTVIAADQSRKATIDRLAFSSWCALGVLMAVLVSLHATTLYVTPIVFAVIAGCFVRLTPSKAHATLLVIFSLAVAALCLTPYWVGEIHSGWQNSRMFLRETFSQTSIYSPLDKIENALRACVWLAVQDYFLGESRILRIGGIIFLGITIVIALMNFRGNRAMFGILLSIWIVFLCAASVYPVTEIRYRFPIITAPIFLTAGALAFLNYADVRDRLLACVLTLGIIASATSNLFMDITHEGYVFGPMRAAAVSDIAESFTRIPQGAEICGVLALNPNERAAGTMPAFAYIDTYMTHRGFHFSTPCVPGDYEILSKNVGWLEYIDHTDYNLAYSRSLGLHRGFPPPANTRIIYQNEAISLILHLGS